MEDDKKNVYEYWEKKYVPYRKAVREDLYYCVKRAEGLFVDILKLLLTLSAAMIAFLAVGDNRFINTTTQDMLPFLLSGYVMTMLAALVAYALMAINYKGYADKHHVRIVNIDTLMKKRDLAGIDEAIFGGKAESSSNGNDAGWQHCVVGFGVGSLTAFLLTTVGIVLTLCV